MSRARAFPPRRDDLPVLLYHQVARTTRDEDPAGLGVAPEAFAAQMKYLHDRGFRTVTLDGTGGAAESPEPGRRIAITFDDGYLDNYTNAFPILQQYRFTATVFLVTDYAGTLRRWESARPVPLMTWSQAEEMSRHGISFQSHTCTHPDLSRCDRRSALDELIRSRETLENRLGRPVRALAYPYGRFDRRTGHLAEEAGYRSAWGAGMTRGGRFAGERLQVTPRDGLPLFALKASGWGGALRKVRHLLRWGGGL